MIVVLIPDFNQFSGHLLVFSASLGETVAVLEHKNAERRNASGMKQCETTSHKIQLLGQSQDLHGACGDLNKRCLE